MKMIAADYDLLKALVVRVVDYNKAPDETPAQFVERYAEHMQVKHPNIKDKFKACRWQLFHVALKPAAGITWDSFSTCPYCGGNFYKVIGTNHKGEAEVTTTNYEV